MTSRLSSIIRQVMTWGRCVWAAWWCCRYPIAILMFKKLADSLEKHFGDGGWKRVADLLLYLGSISDKHMSK